MTIDMRRPVLRDNSVTTSKRTAVLILKGFLSLLLSAESHLEVLVPDLNGERIHRMYRGGQ
ncbi:hypothetical protein CHS0354_005579, partial [Potamilus streckersoni]